MGDKVASAESWDRVANDYHRFAPGFTSLHAYDLLTSISEQIRSARTILDVACGTGAVCMAYMKMFPKGLPGQTLIMTDVSPEMVSIAEREVRSILPSGFQTELQFRAEDGSNMKSVTNNSIDVLVSCFGVFLIPDRDAVLNEVKRVLKRGGTFGTTAWTDLPSEMDVKTPGFGVEFQATVGAAFDKLRTIESSEESSAETPPWKVWGDPDVIRKHLGEAFFAKVRVHRTIHSTVFGNIELLWTAVTRTCPFVDLSKYEPDQLKEVRDALRVAVGVENEDDVVYVVMSSNIVVAVVDS